MRRDDKPLFVDDAAGVEALVGEIATSTGPIALDTETSGLEINGVRVRLMQIKTAPDAQPTIVDCQAVDPAPLLEALRYKRILGHNLP